jgi:hypothetical protein
MTPTIKYPTVLGENRGVLHLGTNTNLINTPDGQGCSITIKVAPLRIKLNGRGNFDKMVLQRDTRRKRGLSN